MTEQPRSSDRRIRVFGVNYPSLMLPSPPPRSLLSILLGDCFALLLSFTEIKLTHVRRMANNATHLLAKAFNPSSVIRKEWLHPPPFIRRTILNKIYLPFSKIKNKKSYE